MKKRRLSTILIAFLLVVMCGVGGYAVYAAVTYSLYMTNTIKFYASDNVYYFATVNVAYDDGEQIATDTINHNGVRSEQDLSKDTIALGDITFKRNQADTDYKKIIYTISITNYTEVPINVKLNKPVNSGVYYTNTLDKTGIQTLSASADGGAGGSVVFTITTTLDTAQYSFYLDNSFSVDMTR